MCVYYKRLCIRKLYQANLTCIKLPLHSTILNHYQTALGLVTAKLNHVQPLPNPMFLCHCQTPVCSATAKIHYSQPLPNLIISHHQTPLCSATIILLIYCQTPLSLATAKIHFVLPLPNSTSLNRHQTLLSQPSNSIISNYHQTPLLSATTKFH